MSTKDFNYHNFMPAAVRTVLFCSLLLAAVAPAGSLYAAEAANSGNDLSSYYNGIKNPDEMISLNFDQVDIRVMIKTIGDITGINFVVDDSVTGTVTVMLPTKIRLGDIHKVLEAVLEVKGYAAVPSGGLVKIVPAAKAIKQNVNVRFGADPDEIPENDTIVTQVIPLSYADVAEVSTIVKGMLPSTAYIATYPKTNSILITDISSNIHRVARVIRKLDMKGSEEKVSVMGLKHASASVLAEHITEIMLKDGSAGNGRNRTSQNTQAGRDLRILPDTRTNSLIIIAGNKDTETIKTLITQLDIDRPDVADNVHVVYLKNAKAIEAADSLTAALSSMRTVGELNGGRNINVTADEGTNALIVTASKQDYEIVAEVIEKLDIVREQVLVEMLIMEISQESLTEIGVDWGIVDETVSNGVRAFGSTNLGPRVDYINGTLEGLAVGAWTGSSTITGLKLLVSALEQNSDVNILSTPHILTSNHTKARIVVGQNIPYVVESRITETDVDTPTVIDNFEYKDVGISLEIVPHISQDKRVRLEIESEFTKLIQGVTGSSIDTPTTAKRQAETEVSMNDGATIVIGGLIRDDTEKVVNKIPLLGDLPLVGGLFQYASDETQKTNLLIFITPHVIADQNDMNRVSEKKKGEMSEEIEELLKDSDDSKQQENTDR